MWQGWVTSLLGTWLALAPTISLDVPQVRLNYLFIGFITAVVSGDAPTEKLWRSGLGLAAGLWVALSSVFRILVVGDMYRWSNRVSGFLLLTSGCSMLARSRTEKCEY